MRPRHFRPLGDDQLLLLRSDAGLLFLLGAERTHPPCRELPGSSSSPAARSNSRRPAASRGAETRPRRTPPRTWRAAASGRRQPPQRVPLALGAVPLHLERSRSTSARARRLRRAEDDDPSSRPPPSGRPRAPPRRRDLLPPPPRLVLEALDLGVLRRASSSARTHQPGRGRISTTRRRLPPHNEGKNEAGRRIAVGTAGGRGGTPVMTPTTRRVGVRRPPAEWPTHLVLPGAAWRGEESQARGLARSQCVRRSIPPLGRTGANRDPSAPSSEAAVVVTVATVVSPSWSVPRAPEIPVPAATMSMRRTGQTYPWCGRP